MEKKIITLITAVVTSNKFPSNHSLGFWGWNKSICDILRAQGAILLETSSFFYHFQHTFVPIKAGRGRAEHSNQVYNRMDLAREGP